MAAAAPSQANPEAAPCGPCERPLRLEREEVDPQTGRAETRAVYMRCGSTRETRCRHCALVYRRDFEEVARSGWHPGKPLMALVLTAPSFGPQHHLATPDGKRCTPQSICRNCGGRVASCRRVHDRGDEIAGAPVCSCFDYERAAHWNRTLSALWSESMRRVNALRRKNGQPRVSYLAAREWQLRGSLHLHVVARGAVEEAEIRRVLAKVEVDGCRWGKVEMSVIPAGDLSAADKLFKYMAKHATKRGRDTMVSDAGPHAEHLAWLHDTAETQGCGSSADCGSPLFYDLPLGPDCANCRRAAAGLGYGGHTLTKSRDWGLSFKALRDARRRRQAKSTVIAGPWQVTGMGYLPEHSEYRQAAVLSRGNLPPPAERRLVALSRRMRLRGIWP